jgi:stage II sporulation SpoE-like protein
MPDIRPPIPVRPDRRAEILHPHDHLLGYAGGFRKERADHRTLLAPGSTLLLYTDGLVERSRADIDAKIAKLASLAAGITALDTDRLAEAVVRRSVGTSRHDGVALLVVHVPARP